MPKNHPAYNLKIKTPSLSLPIYQDFYAQKICPLTFTKEFRSTLTTKISHLLQIVYKWRRNTSHFYCRSRSALSEYFFAFLLLSQSKKKAPHFPWDFRSTLNTQNSHLLHFVYILSPFLKQNDIFQTLISFFEQQKIWLGFLRFLIGFPLFNCSKLQFF